MLVWWSHIQCYVEVPDSIDTCKLLKILLLRNTNIFFEKLTQVGKRIQILIASEKDIRSAHYPFHGALQQKAQLHSIASYSTKATYLCRLKQKVFLHSKNLALVKWDPIVLTSPDRTSLAFFILDQLLLLATTCQAKYSDLVTPYYSHHQIRVFASTL